MIRTSTIVSLRPPTQRTLFSELPVTVLRRYRLAHVFALAHLYQLSSLSLDSIRGVPAHHRGTQLEFFTYDQACVCFSTIFATATVKATPPRDLIRVMCWA